MGTGSHGPSQFAKHADLGDRDARRTDRADTEIGAAAAPDGARPAEIALVQRHRAVAQIRPECLLTREELRDEIEFRWAALKVEQRQRARNVAALADLLPLLLLNLWACRRRERSA